MTTSPAAVIMPPLDLPGRRRPRSIAVLALVTLALIAGVLGFAAYMKLTTSQTAFARVVATLEVVFIVSLALLRKRWWSWATATTLFAAFAGFTGYLMWRGEASCGCFGSIETPPAQTFSIDLTLLTLSAAVTLLLSGSTRLFGTLATLVGVGALAGAGFAVLHEPPLASDFHGDRMAMLLDAPAMADVAQHNLANPDWLVYIFDEKSADDAAALDMMRADAQAHADDEALRVRVLTTDQAEEMSGVPGWAWERLPMAILFRAGAVVQRYTDETGFEKPEAIRASHPTGPIAQVLALPKYADILYAVDDLPVYLVYVYNPECPICIEHLALLETFQEEHPQDPNVVIEAVSMADLEKNMNIPMWRWPGVPTTYVVRAGRVIAQSAGPNGVPNPYQISLDLSKGKPLVLPKAK